MFNFVELYRKTYLNQNQSFFMSITLQVAQLTLLGLNETVLVTPTKVLIYATMTRAFVFSLICAWTNG